LGDSLGKKASNRIPIRVSQFNQKLTALENPGIAVRFENFWQRFGNGNKKGEKCPAAIY
jgi:hypothetical protein